MYRYDGLNLKHILCRRSSPKWACRKQRNVPPGITNMIWRAFLTFCVYTTHWSTQYTTQRRTHILRMGVLAINRLTISLLYTVHVRTHKCVCIVYGCVILSLWYMIFYYIFPFYVDTNDNRQRGYFFFFFSKTVFEFFVFVLLEIFFCFI